jgi:succinyl-CoA synthetase beta subunit
VKKVLVEEKLEIEKEFYLGIIVDGSREVRGPVVIFSTQGGIDVEQVAKESPDKVGSLRVDYLKGIYLNEVDELVNGVGVSAREKEPLSMVVSELYRLFVEYEARSAEINPLVLTRDGRVIAADCRITVDDSAIFRHPELGIKVAREFPREPTPLEEIAYAMEVGDYRGSAFFSQMVETIDGPGYVGYHGIGGGGAILGVDALNRRGLKIANYSDSSGDPTASKVYRLSKTILAIPGIEGYLLGGFIAANQEQWHHAHALVKAFREELVNKPGFPVVLMICGNKEKESHAILKEGLSDLPIRFEVYGSEYVYNPDFIAGRMRALVDEYRADMGVRV